MVFEVTTSEVDAKLGVDSVRASGDINNAESIDIQTFERDPYESRWEGDL